MDTAISAAEIVLNMVISSWKGIWRRLAGRPVSRRS
jgi:hypothetical protein